jgi:hypothetical protein
MVHMGKAVKQEALVVLWVVPAQAVVILWVFRWEREEM